jgi:hypothetical protein
MNIIRILISIYIIVFAFSCSIREKEWIVANKNKTLFFKLQLNNGKLSYAIDAISSDGKKRKAIEQSDIGLLREDDNFTEGFEFLETSLIKEINEEFTMLVGKQKKITNYCLEQVFTFKNKNGKRLQIIVRAYSDAIAFRYAFPDSSKGIFKVTKDITAFKVPSQGRAWIHPYMKVDTWAPSYESEWQNGIKIGTPAPDTVGWAMPALFNTNDLWIMITEAGIDTACFATHFQQNCENGLYITRLPETNETYGVAPQYAEITLPWKSPWKVIIVGSTPKTILETNVVHSLSAPCVLKDTSWIKPGRVSWSWWSDPSSPSDFKKLIPFIDLSAKLGWEYSLLDLGWHVMKNGGDVKKLIEYAKSKNVGIILWYNSGGEHNKVSDACPCNIINDPQKRKEEFKKLQEWGVKGVKIDFMQSDKQYIMKLYQDILKDAAEYKLFVDFHGATIPRGWARTYPNLLTQEAIRGAEQYWDTVFAKNAHTFHTIYTFTRNVVGSMDYTPVIFSMPKGKVPHKTTNAHELATSVAFESGLQHFADDAKSYLSQPKYVLDFLSEVPVTWDETKYLDGEPGKLTLIARRKGQKWFVAGLNGLKENQIVTVKFDFLGEGIYKANIIKDGKDQFSYENEIIDISKNQELKINMAGRGGFVIVLQRK